MFVASYLPTMTSCEGNKALSCFNAKINEIKQTEVTNPLTEVWKWVVDGKT